MAHSRIRAFNKHIFNRLIRIFAGTSRTPFAMIRHVGRRSGTAYATPIIVMSLGESFVIALTYGPEVDWYRNVLAAGRSTLLWHGRVYALEQPEPLAVAAGLAAFPQPFRLILGLVGTQHFVRLRSAGVVPEARRG
jgi:deazaflavin-dependent oxidoreductase (nitroreductase family)